MKMMLQPKTKMTPAQNLPSPERADGGELHLRRVMAVGHNSIDKTPKLSALEENSELFAPSFHLILLQFSVAGWAGCSVRSLFR